MGIQTMGIYGSDQQSHSQPRQNLWYGLKLREVEQNLGKPLGSMNLDELVDNVCTVEANDCFSPNVVGINNSNVSAAAATSLQLQASLTLVRALSGRTVDEVWRDINRGAKSRTFDQEMEEGRDQERASTLGDITLENFLIRAGIFAADSSLAPTMRLNRMLSTPQVYIPQVYTPHMGLPSSPSVETLSDAPENHKRYVQGDVIEKTLDRRLKRKIKNRESAARSRARKQAYQNELVSKVSHLEEVNMKLKKEKELDNMLQFKSSLEKRYQLRRTSSF